MRGHDVKIHALMNSCLDRNIKLNKVKAQLHRKEVPFMGHVITNKGLKADPDEVRAVLSIPSPTDVAGSSDSQASPITSVISCLN